MKYLKSLALPYPTLSSPLFFILFCNTVLWRELFKVKNGISVDSILFFTPLFLVLLLTLTLFFSLFRFKYLFKTILIFFFCSAAAIDYFMRSYGVVIDKNMIQNALETDFHEAFELLTAQLFWHLFLLGVIPSALLINTQIVFKPFLKQLLQNLAVIFISAGLVFGLCYFFYGDYTSIYRNNRQIRHLITPANLVDSTIGNITRKLKRQHPLVALGMDAKLKTNPQQSTKKNLTILVLGETARAANFSLNGYAHQTNRYLSKQAVFNFSNVYSCGTATAASVPCMFSVFGRENYNPAVASYTENVLDVLTHAGVKVLWRDNNSGCKEVCNRVSSENLTVLNLPALCHAGECYDEVLLYHLQEYVDKLANNGVIVLHQEGSHGPGYHLRHPANFKIFTPECQKAMLNDCTQQEVINAYDNTIAYTDYFLSQVIEFLKKNSEKYNTAMLYVSDHGESLGENNVYLHGLPYFAAPDGQKHVPLITWFSNGFLSDHHIKCELRAEKPVHK
jgi:lipid A ethanolaminephosphotransferase